MESLQEEWRAVQGFEGSYEVSDQGRVRSIDRVVGPRRFRGQLLRTRKHNQGYHQIMLAKDGKKYYPLAHHLVAAAFIGPRPDGYDINHKNGKKQDNRPQNLEYVPHATNVRHAFESGLVGEANRTGERNGRSKITADVVRKIREMPVTMNAPEIIRTLALPLTISAVCRIRKRESWGHVA